MNTQMELLFERLHSDTYYSVDRENCAVTKDELEALINSKDYDTSDGLTIEMIAAHPNVPQEWARSVAMQNETVLGAVYTTGGMWNDNIISAWLALAKNPYVDSGTLELLYSNRIADTFLLQSLAGNPSTPLPLLEKMVPNIKLPLTLYQRIGDEEYEDSGIPYTADFGLLQAFSARDDLTNMSTPALKELIAIVKTSLLRPVSEDADFIWHLKIIGKYLDNPKTAKMIDPETESVYIVKLATR